MQGFFHPCRVVSTWGHFGERSMGILHNSWLWSSMQSSHFRRRSCLEIEFGFNLGFKSHRQRCPWKDFRSHLVLCPCHVHGLVYRQKGLACVEFLCAFQTLTFNVPGDSVVKNPPANAGAIRDTRFDPWVRKIPWRRKWQPTPVFLPGELHGRRSTEATICGVAKNQTWLSN